MFGHRKHFDEAAQAHGQHPMNYAIQYSSGGHDHVQFASHRDVDTAVSEVKSSGGKLHSVEGYKD